MATTRTRARPAHARPEDPSGSTCRGGTSTTTDEEPTSISARIDEARCRIFDVQSMVELVTQSMAANPVVEDAEVRHCRTLKIALELIDGIGERLELIELDAKGAQS